MLFADDYAPEMIDGRYVEHLPRGYGAPDDDLDDWHFPDAERCAELSSTAIDNGCA